jgi:hypothetical protein
MWLKTYKIVMLFVLLITACLQGLFLFKNWTQIPRQNVSFWRIEYANLDLENDHDHLLNMQVRVESPPNFKKNAPPDLELLLTDVSGQVVGYQIFSAEEWLPPNLLLKNDWLVHGVPSQTEITLNLPLDAPVEASGFQVHLLYR